MATKKLAWAELRVGILVIASFGILAFAIILISGGAGFFTPKYLVKTYFSSASGLRKGSLVWLAGIEVGNVSSVNITASPDPNRAVEVTMQVNRDFQSAIREDSLASLGSIGLLGDKYVDISRGSETAKIVHPGGVIKGSAEVEFKKIIQNSNDLVANLGDLVQKINEITNKINVGQGTIGKFINDPTLYNKLNSTVAESQDLLTKVKSGEGSVGKLISDHEFYDRLNGTLARVDRIVAMVENGEGTAGKLVKDPNIYNRADSLLSKFNSVADRVDKGQGFLGRITKDDQLYSQFQDAVTKFSAVVDKLNHGEGTAGKLFVDESLYNNLNAASTELVKLLYDFRQDPKRYLRIKIGLF